MRQQVMAILPNHQLIIISFLFLLAAVLDTDTQKTTLEDQVKELKETASILISQIQMLRSEVKGGNALVNKTFQ